MDQTGTSSGVRGPSPAEGPDGFRSPVRVGAGLRRVARTPLFPDLNPVNSGSGGAVAERQHSVNLNEERPEIPIVSQR